MELSARTILELTEGPELQHKGVWAAWFGGVFVCAVTAFSILFADELFRWDLSFRVRDVEQAEPSDWEIASRYIGWTGCLILALVVALVGVVLAGKAKAKDGVLTLGGRDYQLFQPETAYLAFFLTVVITAVLLLAPLALGTAMAYYGIWAMAAWLFILAVYFTSKLM